MGNIVGGIIGGVGSLLGGQQAKQADFTGYNYLKGNAANQAAQGAVAPSLAAQDNALGSAINSINAESAPIAQQGAYAAKQGGVGDTVTSLLTGQGGNAALNNYLNSSGYKFQLDQGTRAIGGSASARGLLGSGSTAKALAGYGQGLAGNYFGNYINQLQGAGNTYGNTATSFGNNANAFANQGTGFDNVASQYGNRATLGVNAAGQVADNGTRAGTVSGEQQNNPKGGMASGIGGLASAAMGLFGI